MKSISILGATGSIGTQTLDVIRNSKERINLIGITANSSVDKIKEIIQEFKPKYVGMMESNSAKKIKVYCDENYPEIQVFSGIEGLIKIATLDEIDTVVTSVVGMIGLKPTIAALEDLKDVTVKEALKHPKWNMGQKISIDSASLMNKGLEVIEAHFLFDKDYDNIEVVIHPQSIIHSMVEYKDASIIAQMGTPDMRLPIQYALNYPERKEMIAKPLNFYEVGSLTFEKPDLETFKCLKFAYEAGRIGGLAPTILNGANEEAVALLLEEKIKFLQISEIIEECMIVFKDNYYDELTLENIVELDEKVKKYIREKWALGVN